MISGLLVLPGCDAVPPELEGEWLRVQRGWRVLMSRVTGAPMPSPRPSGSPAPEPSPDPSASAAKSDEFMSANARNAKANAELLHEVYAVVFLREPRDRAEFGSLVDSMNQGASLEGMHNGFTHSSDYHRLETTAGSASPVALRVFGEELAVLEAELPSPVEFDAQSKPVASPTADGIHVIEYGKSPRPSPLPSPHLPTLADKYAQHFVGASVYVLKRILADEALRVIGTKKQYPEKLALWYSKWVVHMAGRKVDYGISQRNQPDEEFHYKWALTAGEDRITWEVLNRIHRALNEANRPKQ